MDSNGPVPRPTGPRGEKGLSRILQLVGHLSVGDLGLTVPGSPTRTGSSRFDDSENDIYLPGWQSQSTCLVKRECTVDTSQCISKRNSLNVRLYVLFPIGLSDSS